MTLVKLEHTATYFRSQTPKQRTCDAIFRLIHRAYEHTTVAIGDTDAMAYIVEQAEIPAASHIGQDGPYPPIYDYIGHSMSRRN
jgi:hypothetical protein